MTFITGVCENHLVSVTIKGTHLKQDPHLVTILPERLA